MKQLLFIALGGAGGALARHGLARLIHASTGSHFPWGTLSINVLGSLGIGVMYALIVEQGMVHPDWRSVTVVGFLGAFTTFSSFSLETVSLLENGQLAVALAYVLSSVLVCVLTAWLAIMLVRLL